MNNFMNYNFNINKIILACFVHGGTGDPVHSNRQSHGIAFFTDGAAEYVFDDGKTFTANKGQIIYLPKHSNYKVHGIPSNNCYAINFDASEVLEFDPFVIKIKNYNMVLDHFKQSTKLWTAKTIGYEMFCKARLYDILYTIQNESYFCYISKEKINRIKPAVDFIHAHYAHELLSVGQLSKLCGITPEYFRSIFKKAYGVSPLCYINNLKMTHAKELLASQMYSVSEAAMQSGYSDLSYFSRTFKDATGVNPSEWKERSN